MGDGDDILVQPSSAMNTEQVIKMERREKLNLRGAENYMWFQREGDLGLGAFSFSKSNFRYSNIFAIPFPLFWLMLR